MNVRDERHWLRRLVSVPCEHPLCRNCATCELMSPDDVPTARYCSEHAGQELQRVLRDFLDRVAGTSGIRREED